MQPDMNTQVQTPVAPVINNNKQSNGVGLKIAIVMISIVAVCGIGLGAYGIVQSAQKDEIIKELQSQVDKAKNEEEKKKTKEVSDASLISNTTWIASGGSEVVFSKNRIDWYQDPKNYDDNYYSGVYKFYMGKDAVKYITQELSQYGVTKSELESLFRRSDEYSEEKFVVFDIRYDKFILNGQEQRIVKPLAPWYGFILDDDTYLDVANMNTGTYYKFTKREH